MSLTKNTPVCVKCCLFMRCRKNGFLVRDPEAGGFSSTYWSGDLWQCPECDYKVVTGFGEQFYEKDLERFGYESKPVLEFRWNPEDIAFNEGQIVCSGCGEHVLPYMEFQEINLETRERGRWEGICRKCYNDKKGSSHFNFRKPEE